MPLLSSLLRALDIDLGSAADRPVHRVTADSRLVEPGTIFVAVVGERFDGHAFIAAALERGAAVVVGTASPAALAADAQRYLQVPDSRRALAVLSAALHGYPSRHMAIIGVTGTDGKTTTCTLIEAILTAATSSPLHPFGRAGVITTIGARFGGREQETGLHVTTPDAPDVQAFLAQMHAAGCTHAVVECTSHGLAQERVAAVDFDVAAVTNITHEHLDYHGSLEAYTAAKAKLFRALYASPAKPDTPRCAVLNADDPLSFPALSRVLAEETARSGRTLPLRTYGLPVGARWPDVFARDLHFGPDRTRFRLCWWDGELQVESRLVGEFNVYNMLCAAAAALAVGVPASAVQSGIAAVERVAGRMERIDRGQPFLALVDFAHSPASLERALLALRPLAAAGATGAEPGRLIAVFGCAGLRDRAKRRLMGEVSGRLADFTVITAEDPRTEDLVEINRTIAAGVLTHASESAFAVIADRAAALQFAVDLARPGDVVAAFGKGHERSMCFGETEFPWSDQEALAAALDRRLGRR